MERATLLSSSFMGGVSCVALPFCPECESSDVCVQSLLMERSKV